MILPVNVWVIKTYVVLKKEKVLKKGKGQCPQMGLMVKITQNTNEKFTFLSPTQNY